MKAILSVHRKINLETGEVIFDKLREVEITKEQMEVFCFMLHRQLRYQKQQEEQQKNNTTKAG